MHAAVAGDVAPGEVVVVLGAGGVGLAVVQEVRRRRLHQAAALVESSGEDPSDRAGAGCVADAADVVIEPARLATVNRPTRFAVVNDGLKSVSRRSIRPRRVIGGTFRVLVPSRTAWSTRPLAREPIFDVNAVANLFRYCLLLWRQVVEHEVVMLGHCISANPGRGPAERAFTRLNDCPTGHETSA